MAVIAGLGTYLPEPRQSAADIARASGLPEAVVRDKLGIHSKPVPGPEDHVSTMAARASRAALADAGLDAQAVDTVVCINEEHKDYPVWTSGIQLAHDIGAKRAYAFDIGQKCGSGVLGLKLAADMLHADPHLHTALVAGGYRNSDLIDYSDPDVRFLYNLGAGAGAAVVRRSGPGHTLLGSSFVTDGSFAGDVLVPVGGSRAPLTPDNVGEYRLQVRDMAGMRERMASRSVPNFLHVLREAVARSGAQVADLRHVAMLHMKRSAHDAILDELGLGPEHSIYLADYGHIGQVDGFLSLQLAAQQGRLRRGDLVVIVAAGIGYVWNAICLRWEGGDAA